MLEFSQGYLGLLDGFTKGKVVWDFIEGTGVVDKVKDKYEEWSQEQENREIARLEEERQKLWQSITNLYEQESYEKVLPLLQQVIQKYPHNKAVALYFLASCYFHLDRHDEALRSCEMAIKASPNEEVLQGIYDLKKRIMFGSGFWIKWLASTLIIGTLSFIGTIGVLGEQIGSSAAGLLGVLVTGISIGLVQWLLIRLQIAVGLGTLIATVVVVLVSLTIAMIFSSINGWLSLPIFLVCTILFTALSMNRLVKQVEFQT